MLDSSLTPDKLKSVKFEYVKAVENAFKKGISGSKDPHTESEFQNALKDLLEIFDNKNPDLPALRRGALTSDVEHYIDTVLEEVGKYEGMDSSRLYLSKIGWTAMVFATAKPPLDMYDAWDNTYQILESKRHGKDAYGKTVKKLQDEAMFRLERYVSSHEGNKMVEVKKFRNKYPKINKPFVRISGNYNPDRYAQAKLVGAFGELFNPVLMLLDKDEETAERLKSNIESLRIKNDTKSFLLKKIKIPESLDDLYGGHPQNFNLYVGNIMNIVESTADYFKFHDRKETCMPFWEWEGVCTLLYPQHLVGQKTFYDPEAMNLKIDFVNAVRGAFGYKPIPYVEKLAEDIRRKKERSYIQ